MVAPERRRHSPGCAPRAAGGLRTACDDGDRAPPGRACEPRPLPRRDGRHRRRRHALIHRAGAPRLPRVRAARPGLCPSPVRYVSIRAPRSLLVQGSGDLSQLLRASNGRAGGTPRGSGAALGTGAPVGSHGAVPTALSPGVRSRALSCGAGGRRPHPARLVSPPRSARRRCRWTQRHGHGGAAVWFGVGAQRSSSRARARRRVRGRGGRDVAIPSSSAPDGRRHRRARDHRRPPPRPILTDNGREFCGRGAASVRAAARHGTRPFGAEFRHPSVPVLRVSS